MKSNEELINTINKNQALSIRRIVCANNKAHGALVPKVIDDAVVLKCPVCGSIRYEIPKHLIK